MTQGRIGTESTSHTYFQRQIQNGTGAQTSIAASTMQPLPSSANEKTSEAQWGSTSRHSSLPGPVDPNKTTGSFPVQQEASYRPQVQHEASLRRASAFPFRPFVPNDFGAGTAFDHKSRFSGNDVGQNALQRPWNTSTSQDNQLPHAAARRDSTNVSKSDGGPSPTSAGTYSLRPGSDSLWGTPSSAHPPSAQSVFQSQPSFTRRDNSSALQSAPSDSLGQANSQAATHIFRPTSLGHTEPEPASLLSPSSPNSTRSSAGKGLPSASDIQRSLQSFTFAPSSNTTQRVSAIARDQDRGELYNGGIVRAGSSPGQSSLRSVLGWNGNLRSQWSAEAGPGKIHNGGTLASDPPYNFKPSTGFSPTHGHHDGTQALPMHVSRQEYPRYKSFSEDVLTNRHGAESKNIDGNVDFHHGISQPDLYPRDTHRGVPALSGARNSLFAGRDFVSNSPYFELPHEFASAPLSAFYGGRYPPVWPPAPFTVPPSPGAPLIAEHDPNKVWRSALMDDFRMASRSGRRWELKDVYDHIVEFSGDQHGSRFLQDKLKTANSEEKDRVFQEILPNAVQLMKDVFGNYVLQKFFEHGDQMQKAALVKKMKGHVYALSTQTYACRVVQKALGHILVAQQIELMQELDGKVMECIKCENGNHVIQVAIEQVPLEHIPFMIDAVQHDVQYLSMHKYGCRVIQRMLEHAKDDILIWLIPELHKCSALLIADQFGNYVPAHIVEKGCPEDRNKIIAVVQSNLVQYSKQKFASHVVEKCIRFGADHQRKDFMRLLCSMNERGENELEHLIRDGFANYVVQSLLETLQYNDYVYFCHVLQPALDRARMPSPNKQAENVARRMHRFDQPPIYPHSHPYMPGPLWNHSVFV